MIYRYEAIDKKGVQTFGLVEAINEVQAVRDLNSRALTAVELTPEEGDAQPKKKKKASVEELVMSLHEMVTLLESGVSVSDTLDSQLVANYPEDLSANYETMTSEIRKGASFSSALVMSKIEIPDYIHQLAKAGELVGNLPKSLRNGLDQYEYELALRRDFRAALTYPLILVVSGIAAVLLIFTLVVPKFLPMMEKVPDLPFLSQAVFKVGTFFNEHPLIVLTCLITAVFLSFLTIRSRSLKERVYDICIRWPVLGHWLLETDIARWCSTLGALLDSRVDIIEAIQLSNQGVFSSSRRARFERVVNHVKDGSGLADSLEKELVLTSVGYNLIRSGEKAGKVAPMVTALSKLYDDAGKNRMKKLVGLIEPVAVLLIGVFVGAIVLGVMLAITSVNMSGV